MTTDAVYVRTSTDGQDGAAQIAELERVAPKAARWFIDRGESGTKKSRPALDDLMRETRAGRVRTIHVYALDRLGRSTLHVLGMLREWAEAGIALRSMREGESIDPQTPIGRAIAAILCVIAELDREIIVGRVKSGVRRVMPIEKGGLGKPTRSGKPIGRPRRAVDASEVARRRAAGESWRSIARALHCPAATIRRAVSKPTP